MFRLGLGCALISAELAAQALLPSVRSPDASGAAAGLPPGFIDELVVAGWDRATGLALAPDGRVFVWEKAGRVWLLQDDVPGSTPFLDIADEVGDWEEHGLVGFAIDPDFLTNGFVYALYAVDHHHLEHFGTAQYDPGVNEYYQDTIARLVRYTANPATGLQDVLPQSRLVLLGESASTGIPLTGPGHSPGALAFGDDGTLLVSCGDGSGGASSGTALAEGIISVKEAIGPFRSQLVDSLSGKLLRLDPATGDGVPGNPFFDPGNPRAARSRVYALGLRQPFRMTLRRGSGSTDPAAGRPGTIFLGDVGAGSWEELNVLRAPRLNLGWPLREGMHDSSFTDDLTANLDAPNPQFGVDGCTQQFLDFQDLFQEDASPLAGLTNPCNPALPLVTTAPLFAHERPVLEWSHAASGGAFVPTYDGHGKADSVELGAPGAPVGGGSFIGNCSVGGCWYDGAAFPPEWQQTGFHADYGAGWIRNLVFDAQDQLIEVRPFAEAAGRPVALATDPQDGRLWYINYTDQGVGELRRIRYEPGNLPPLAVIQASGSVGTSPFTVTLDASGSVDPEGLPLGIAWDFGDGTPVSHQPVVTHTFPSEDISAQGAFVGAVFDLLPPGSMGPSNHDPEVMRDGDLPPVSTNDYSRQYDTLHYTDGQLDKPPDDSIGYLFPVARVLHDLLFQEGTNAPGGGWFSSVGVEVLQGGNWVPLPGASFTPAYPGAFGAHYERFDIAFPPVTSRGIRLFGPTGGVANYITIGELRVSAAPLAPAQPQNILVTLTVTDIAGASAQATLTITLDDQPPVPNIKRPDEFFTYDPAVAGVQSVAAAPYDVLQPSEELAGTWQVIHHHDDHNHPGPLLPGHAMELVILADGCDNAVHWVELLYTVTDPLGLWASESRHLVPVCDLNLNGALDADEIAAGKVFDANGDGVPDEAQTDCDGNSRPDLYEIFFGYSADADGNGVPDLCEAGP